MREIKTNNLSQRKKVKIDGHPYIVRRLGAGEQLAINQLEREHKKILEKYADADEEEKQKLAKKSDEIELKLLDIYQKMFDDGGDQTKSKELVNSLDSLEIIEITAEIFSDKEES